MSEPSSAYINDIGGDVKAIIGDGDIKGIIGDIKGGVVNQYIIAQHSEVEIHSRTLKPGSPYLGLNKFEPGDKDKFFGREKWIIELSNDLENNNLLLLLGASGSGKSSLVQAGLIPYLSDQWGASQLVTIIFVPDNNPFASFSENFPKKYQNKASQFFNSPNNLTLIDVIKSCQEESFKWIIFIDQFEELFARTPKLERDRFIASLIPLIQQQDESIKLILAMRSDFLGELQQYADLANKVQKQMRLTIEMTEIELRLAIAEPAARNGVTFEKNLVEQIIDDFYHQAGSLPLLQYTLDLLWREDKPSENNRVLNVATYKNIGGVSGALQKQANNIYNKELDDEERKAAEKIFIELIDLKVKEPISRRVDRSQFRNNETINKVLGKLIDNRLLVSGRDRMSTVDESTFEVAHTVEVAHEQLLRSWQVFQDLIHDKEEIIILRNRLFTDAQQWQRLKEENNSQAEDELWVGYKLERFHGLIDDEEFSSFSEESKKFIQASDERQKQLDNEREEKRQQELKIERTERELANQLLEKEKTKSKFLFTLVVTIILSLLAGVLGWLAWKQQERMFQVIIDINKGQLNSETINLLSVLTKLLERGKEYEKQRDIENAIASYQDVLTLTHLAQKKIQDDITINPKKYKNIQRFPDISEYSEDEKRLAKLKEITAKVDSLLINIVDKDRIPKLERYLKEKKYGKKKVESKPSDFEDQFTPGALQETYKILMIDLGADINKSGYIGTQEEAERMSIQILYNIEILWRENTENKCGWFGEKDNLKAPECQQLNGASLSSLIFYGPVNAQKRLEEVMKDSEFPNPESSKCVHKTIFDVQQSLSKNLNKKPTQVISNSFKITDGSGKIIYSQYPQLIPVGITMDQVIGGYNPNNNQLMLEVNGRLVEMYLLEPLVDNKPVQFVVKKIIRLNDDGNNFIAKFLPPYNIMIAGSSITEGNLEKIGNQIKGDFKTEESIWLGDFIARYKGIVQGEFTLNIAPSQEYKTPENIENNKVITSLVEDCIWKKSDISSEF